MINSHANTILESMLITARAAPVYRTRGLNVPNMPPPKELERIADAQAKADIESGYRIVGPVAPRGPKR